MTNVKSFKINNIDSSISAYGIIYDDSSTSLGAADIQTAIEKSYDKISNITDGTFSDLSYTTATTDRCIYNNGYVADRSYDGDYTITQYISVSKGDYIKISAYGSATKVGLLGFKQTVDDVTSIPEVGERAVDEVLIISAAVEGYTLTTDIVQIKEDGYILCCYRTPQGLTLQTGTPGLQTQLDFAIDTHILDTSTIQASLDTVSLTIEDISTRLSTIDTEITSSIETETSERQTVDSSISDRLSVLEDGEFADLEYTVSATDRYINIACTISERPGGDYAMTQYIPVTAGTYINVSAQGSKTGTVSILGFKQTVDDVTVIPEVGETAIDECLVASTAGDEFVITTAQVYIEEDGYIICCYYIAKGLILQSGIPGLQTQIDTEIKTRQSSSTVSSRVTTLENITEPFNESTPLNYECYDGGALNIFETIAQIGDSLASGDMTYADATDESTTKYIDMYQHSWLSFIGRLTGRTVFNFSRGGASTTSFLAKSTSFPSDYMDGANIFEAFQTNLCQCYFIALGHNDRNAVIRSSEYTSATTSDEQLAILQTAVGTSADIVDVSTLDDNTTDTYYVRYAKVINEIKKIQPYAKIFPITMKTGQSSTSQWETEGWNDAIRYMAEIFTDVYIIDLGKYAPTMPSWHYTQGHGNAMGYSAYGKEIASYVNYIITNNRDYFKYTSFIGTSVQENAIPESTRISIGSSFE